MKRGGLLLTLFIAAFGAAACSGGGSTTLPPPPPNGFSKASLNGQYAFIMTGQAADGFGLMRIGTFVADGNGTIQGGTELVNTASNGFEQLNFSPGTTYGVSSDGRGAINLLNASGPSAYSITFTSPTQGYICETDGNNGASGTFELQDSSALSFNAVTGPFVFDVTGAVSDTNNNLFADSIVGQIILSAGVVQGGVFDENTNAFVSNPVTITNGSGSFTVTDTANGLGTLTFNNNFQYAFVIVNSKKFHMIEIPPTGASFPMTSGTANAQTAPPASNSAFASSYAFLTSGSGTTPADFKAGRFTADGTGKLGSIAMDDKLLAASVTQIPKGTLSAMTYAVDASFPGSGRVTVSFLDSSNSNPYQFIAYMSSATQGVIQDNSPGITGDGTILAQTGAPFTSGSLAGDYAFNWTGTSQNNTTGVIAEEDFVGHVTVTSAASNNVTGAMDLSELNLVDPLKVGIHDSVVTGTATISGDGTTSSGNRSTFQVNATNPNGGPSSTLTFTLYPVNAQTMFVVMQNNDNSTGGTLTRQVTPP